MKSVASGMRSRRQFLIGAITFISGYIPAILLGNNRAADTDACLRDLTSELTGAADLGRHYIALRPAESSAAWLEHRLFGTRLRAVSDNCREQLIRRRIRQARDADWRNGRLLVVRGWVIAETEGRLMALLSLQTP